MRTLETLVKWLLSFSALRRLWRVVAPWLFYGNDRCCVVCHSEFHRFMIRRGREHRCPVCFSEPRHRNAIICLYEHAPLISSTEPLRVLHVAPELCMMDYFLSRPNIEYVSIDLYSRLAGERMDLRRLQFPEEHFDLIYCSHVLEHIREDHQAIKELFRVLKVGGIALVMVPIRKGPTIEDPAVTSPEERKQRYHHPGHVRCYGDDFEEPLEAIKFHMARHIATAGMSEAERQHQGVNSEPLFLCTRQVQVICPEILIPKRVLPE